MLVARKTPTQRLWNVRNRSPPNVKQVRLAKLGLEVRGTRKNDASDIWLRQARAHVSKE